MVLKPVTSLSLSESDRSMFEFVLQGERIAVTSTSSNLVAAAWTRMFQPAHGSFFPVGVAIHCKEGNATSRPRVITLCTRNECLVFKVVGGKVKSRDLLVFLRDVSTCYGWQTAAYGSLIRFWNPTMSLARLTDIQSLLPNQEEPNMTLSHFTNMVWGQPVREPTVTITNWGMRTKFNKKEIEKTVLRAYVCYAMGTRFPTTAPNNSLPRVKSDTYPRLRSIIEYGRHVTTYVVEINATEHIYVKCTNRVSVLVSWMQSHLGGGYLGINPKRNATSRSLVALADGNETFVFKYHGYRSVRADRNLLLQLLGSLRYYTWETEEVGVEIPQNRVAGIRNNMPFTHVYDDLARLVLGYEMERKNYTNTYPNEHELIAAGVEAYVLFRAGVEFGDHQWE